MTETNESADLTIADNAWGRGRRAAVVVHGWSDDAHWWDGLPHNPMVVSIRSSRMRPLVRSSEMHVPVVGCTEWCRSLIRWNCHT